MLVLLTLLCGGCLWATRQATNKEGASKDAAAADRRAKNEEKVKGDRSTKTKETEGEKPSRKSVSEPQAKDGETEDEAIEHMALDLAKKSPNVKTVRICYASKEDEWWITLYEEAGFSLELKQYVWSRERDKLEQFLVLERISKRRLKENLASHLPGSTCRVLTRTEDGWSGTRYASKARSDKRKHEEPPPPSRSETQPRPARESREKGGGDKSERAKEPGPDQSSKPRSDDGFVPNYLVFVYGSDMNHRDLMEWLQARGYDPSRILDATPAKLDGYGFVWNYYSQGRGGGTVNIEPKKDSSVFGLLLNIEASLLKAFDRKAGHPSFYRREEQRVPVKRLEDGKTVLAWIYRAKPNKGEKRNVFPTPGYKEKVVEAAKFWGFPKDYVEKLRAWPTQ